MTSVDISVPFPTVDVTIWDDSTWIWSADLEFVPLPGDTITRDGKLWRVVSRHADLDYHGPARINVFVERAA